MNLIDSFVIVLASLAVMRISFHLFHKAAGTMDLRSLNLISTVFYYDLVTLSLVGSVLVLNGWAQSYTLNYITFSKTAVYVWLSVLYVMIAMPAAMILTGRLLRITSVRTLLNKYFQQYPSGIFDERARSELPALLALSIITLACIIYTLKNTASIPFIELIKGASRDQLALLRIQAKRNYVGIVQISTIFGTLLGPVMVYIAYVYFRINRKIQYLLWFIIMLISTATVLLYDLAKAPILHLSLGFMMVYILLRGKIKIVKQLVYAFLIIISAIFLFKITKGIEEMKAAIAGVIERVTVTQIEGTYHMFEIFPTSHEFVKGRSLSRAASSILKYEYIEPAERIAMKTIYPTAVSENRAGLMSTLFIGDAWANFGLIGVLVSPIIVGICLELIYILLLKSPKSPLTLGFYGFISSHNYVQGGFVNGFLFNTGLLAVIFILFLVYFFTGLTRRKILWT